MNKIGLAITPVLLFGTGLLVLLLGADLQLVQNTCRYQHQCHVDRTECLLESGTSLMIHVSLHIKQPYLHAVPLVQLAS